MATFGWQHLTRLGGNNCAATRGGCRGCSGGAAVAAGGWAVGLGLAAGAAVVAEAAGVEGLGLQQLQDIWG